ncbi:MFS transporter [Lacticaseibacillus sharpeae]|uniref:MFS transporter n=1 Tax=Lacticaseibacillus sharpeae TaxID=1626 RepID=UPI001CDAD77C|nr:MFS transporter [Lacticaseibacillus sharpeae]
MPQVLLGPMAGLASDRFDRRLVSVTADTVMGLLALVYALLLANFALPNWTVLLMLLVRGVGDTFQEPAIQSLLPQLVPQDQLLHTNGWLQLLRGGAFMFGPMIGAALYATLPLPWVLMSDLIGALIASAALLMVQVPQEKQIESENRNPERLQLRDWRAGLKVYRRDRSLRVMLIADACTMGLYAPLASLYPLMTSGYFKLSAGFGSAIEFCFAVGMLVSAAIFATKLKVRHHLLLAGMGIALMGICAIWDGLMPATLLGWCGFALGCLLLGAAGNVHSIPFTTYIQTSVPTVELGRTLAVQTMINGATMPVGLVLASPVANLIGVNHWFVVAGSGMVVCAAVVVWQLRE